MNALNTTRGHYRESALRNFVRTLSLAMCKLNQIQFDAPWNPRRRGC